MHGGLAGLVEHGLGDEPIFIGVRPYGWKLSVSIPGVIMMGLMVLETGWLILLGPFSYALFQLLFETIHRLCRRLRRPRRRYSSGSTYRWPRVVLLYA